MQRIKTFKTLSRAVSAASFLSVQALICMGTVYWAVAETLGLSGTGALILAVIFAAPSALVLVTVVRMAFDAETDPANQ
jgi:asparagine N-glycosylation enzyme membrane subunit Stt3